jgi:hypothetical protein
MNIGAEASQPVLPHASYPLSRCNTRANVIVANPPDQAHYRRSAQLLDYEAQSMIDGSRRGAWMIPNARQEQHRHGKP